MSTRAFITIKGLKAGLYRHSDGYPKGEHGVMASLRPLVDVFRKERGNDPQYFMAQLTAQQVTQFGDGFLGFGIMDTSNPKLVNCAFHYQVDLDTGDIHIKKMGA